jgi:hypothetical protein
VCSSSLELRLEISSKTPKVIQLVHLFSKFVSVLDQVSSLPQIPCRTAYCSYRRTVHNAKYPPHCRLADFLTVPPCAINIKIQTTKNKGSPSFLMCILKPATSHCPVFCISQIMSSLQPSLSLRGHCIEIFWSHNIFYFLVIGRVSLIAQQLPLVFFVLVVRFLLGNSPASEVYMPTFRNTLYVQSSQAGKCV